MRAFEGTAGPLGGPARETGMTARSPRGPFMAAALSLLLMAGACRDAPTIVVKSDGGTSVLTGRSGAVVEAADDGKSLAVPADLPAFAPAQWWPSPVPMNDRAPRS